MTRIVPPFSLASLWSEGGDTSAIEADVVALQSSVSGLTSSKADKDLVTNVQAGTSYTLQLSDRDAITKMVECTNASPFTLTVPANADVAFPVGSCVNILNGGAGQVTVAPAVGVTVDVEATLTLALLGQHAMATLYKSATNTWKLVGLLEAA